MAEKGSRRIFYLTVLLHVVSLASLSSAAFLNECNEQKIAAIWSGGFIPKCDPKGDFEPVQCDLQLNECYCVHTKTGEEIANTRVQKPSIPNCDYPALGATQVDLIKTIAKNRGKDIKFTAESFNSKPSYEFQSSQTIYALATDYFPPSLWPDFSILATVKPMSLEGGFLFALVDSLETVIQLGLSISKGDNEYTQNINLWYSENPLVNGYMKIAEFTVPVMVGRWSRFAIGVNGTNISLHLYCKSYAVEEYKRSRSNLNFMAGSYVLIGHGGDMFTQPFDGDIQELLLTNDPDDAARQCEIRTDDKKKQEPGGEFVIGEDRDRAVSGFLDDNESPLLTTNDSTPQNRHVSSNLPRPQPAAAPEVAPQPRSEADHPKLHSTTQPLSSIIISTITNHSSLNLTTTIANSSDDTSRTISETTTRSSNITTKLSEEIPAKDETELLLNNVLSLVNRSAEISQLSNGSKIEMSEKPPVGVAQSSSDGITNNTYMNNNTTIASSTLRSSSTLNHSASMTLDARTTSANSATELTGSTRVIDETKLLLDKMLGTTNHSIGSSNLLNERTTNLGLAKNTAKVTSSSELQGSSVTATVAPINVTDTTHHNGLVTLQQSNVTLSEDNSQISSTMSTNVNNSATKLSDNYLEITYFPKNSTIKGSSTPPLNFPKVEMKITNSTANMSDNNINGAEFINGEDADLGSKILNTSASVSSEEDVAVTMTTVKVNANGADHNGEKSEVKTVKPGEDSVETGSGLPIMGEREPVDPDAGINVIPDEIITKFFWQSSTEAFQTTSPSFPEGRVPGPAVEVKANPVTIPGPKGEIGPKGETGDVGPAGIEREVAGDLGAGPSVIGIKGDKGDTGPPGSPGKHGVNGIPGLEGAIGSPGLTGEKGKKGEAGVGEPGLPGIPGDSIKGDAGTPGEKGDKGQQGDSVVGPQGPPGKSFFMELEELMIENGSGEEPVEDIFSRVPTLELLRGPKGEKGNCTAVDGMPGRDGVDGEHGVPGLPGASGERGEPGERGAQGLQGPKGEDGGKGDQGVAGPKGEKGEHGERGPQGIQGPPGPAAVQSEGVIKEGVPGEQGQPGESGEPGEKGEKGAPGVQGVAGEHGAPGKDGAEGPQGPRGADGINGQPGLPGVTGKQGMSGINGTKGDRGEPGVGVPGPAGPPGPPGPSVGRPFMAGGGDNNLTTGAKGEKGEVGATGAPGALDLGDLANIIPLLKEKGDKGDPGEKGEEGSCVTFKGQRGRRGHRGLKGHSGAVGPKGIIGAPGFPGQNGIPGAPGTPGDSIKGEKGDAGECGCDNKAGLVDKAKSGDRVVTEGPRGPQGPPGETVIGPRGPPGPPGLPGGAIKLNTGSSLGNIIMFTDQDMMTSSSLAIPSGTLGFVTEEQRLYIRVNLGWQAISTGPIIPMSERAGESNSLPFLQEFSSMSMKDAAAATGRQHAAGLLRLYALNSPLSAKEISGVSGADYQCYKQARDEGISGTFRAVLTSRLQSIDSLVFHKDNDMAIANSKGERLLESWSGVTNDKGYWSAGVPIYTFNGTNIHTDDKWSIKHFWHGATSTGKADLQSYCQAWTSHSDRELGASSSFITGQVLDKSLYTCDHKLAVFCVETTLPEVYRQR